MAKDNARLEAARKAYREALDAARTGPTPEAWARLLAAGKELSSTTDAKPRSRRRRTAQVAADVIAADVSPSERVEAEPEAEALE
jgi:hypothetical protein